MKRGKFENDEPKPTYNEVISYSERATKGLVLV